VHETALASPETVDLGGRCVLPGFTDSHVHFPTWAMTKREVKLEEAISVDDAIARIRESGRRRGYGWRDADWPEKPHRAHLDAVSDEPMAFISKDFHSLWLNSAALALAGGDLEVEGGVVERDADGEPTGVLREEAAWRFKNRYLEYAPDEYVDAMREGMKLAGARGVVAYHDKDGWLGAIGLWQRLEQQTPLTLRVWQSTPWETIPQLRELGLRSGLGSPYLRLGYLKAFMDGTLGSQTAWMLDDSGVCITSGAQLAEIVREAAEIGWPVGVHAIGDKANREALDAFEQTREVWQPLGLRQRIEHAQCVHPDDLPRFARLGVAVSPQFTHAPSDEHLAHTYWSDKLEQTYSFKSLLDSGALLANGSDAPVEELEPWAGVLAAVLDHWRPDQRLTLAEALHAVCVAPAWLSHDERVRGTLIPGRYADLVVLDRDPFSLDDLEELREVQVVATMVGGRWTHNPPPWD
jgi:predicted amidohydrolase YtcJ